MNYLVIILSVAAVVASAPTHTDDTVINVDGPNGRHVQTGQPGKAVTGYFTSRNTDGVEYTTMYEADEKGFRVNGLHLPVSSAFPLLYPISALPNYGFRYGSQSEYPMGDGFLSYDDILYKQGEDGLPLFTLGQHHQTPLTVEDIAALTERSGLLGLPFLISAKLTKLFNKFLLG